MNKVYQIITERIIDRMKQGIIPWQRPWHARQQTPKNLVTKLPYHGTNFFLLWSLGYESPYFLTMRQANELGGSIRAGEKALPVVFWKILKFDEEISSDGQPKKVPMLRYYHVFNSSQCENLAGKIPSYTDVDNPFSPIEAAELAVDNMPARPCIEHGHTRAYYSPVNDLICLPSPERFDRPEDYYATLFHELVHSTGHATRLSRRDWLSGDDKHDAYSKEELVAEMGATFLCAETGILASQVDRSAAYIQSWIETFENNHRLIFTAATHAQKAVDFILNRMAVHVASN